MSNRNTTLHTSAYSSPSLHMPAPFKGQLEEIFEALPDEELIATLEATRWTGRPGYPISILWRTYAASFILNIPTFSELIRRLHGNPLFAATCGISAPAQIPSTWAYSRFLKKLAGHRELLAGCMDSVVRELAEGLPGFGETVAIDSSDLKAHSNGSKRRKSDPDAAWSAKRGSNGKKKFWFGYKEHILCDAKTEIPLATELTAANVHDSHVLGPLLEKTARSLPDFQPRHVLCDAGYDTKAAYRTVLDLGADPIIQPRKHRAIRKGQGGIGGSWRLEGEVQLLTEEWNELYAQRGSVERVFSRLKLHRKLNDIWVRRQPKVEVHTNLSVLVLQASALSRLNAGRADQMRLMVAA